jgi:hypothetical protein
MNPEGHEGHRGFSSFFMLFMPFMVEHYFAQNAKPC